ncbi:MAG: hypothetical protein JSR39_02555, partial [Verrucomicrobia bacterium]|nr:hypothetical protein [Verrucomicrobiota bacterium]
MATLNTALLTAHQPAASLGELQTQNPVLQSLWQIFDKVRTGLDLSSEEIR